MNSALAALKSGALVIFDRTLEITCVRECQASNSSAKEIYNNGICMNVRKNSEMD